MTCDQQRRLREIAEELRADMGCTAEMLLEVLTWGAVREAISKMGMEAAPSSPEEFSRVVNSDMARWGAVVRSVGIKVD